MRITIHGPVRWGFPKRATIDPDEYGWRRREAQRNGVDIHSADETCHQCTGA